MVSINAPSPKRRKTGNGPVTANDIAQTNSTAQLFAGQHRINRWMQGYVPESQEQPLAQSRPQPTTSASSSARVVSGAAPTRAPANVSRTRPSQDPGQGRFNTFPMAAPSAPPPGGRLSHGSTSSPVTVNVSSSLVDYEFPAVATATHIPASSSASNAPPKSIDHIARTTAPASSQPGLPSPVSSDGNTNSPAMHVPFTSQTSTLPPGAVSRGQPSRQPSLSSGYNPALPRGQQAQVLSHQRLPSQPRPSLAMMPPQLPSNANMHGHPPMQIHSPVGGQLPTGNLNLGVMSAKLKALRASVRKLNPIENGRLLLLQEAIDKQDFFYVVLSQLHALSSKPAQLPTAARNLPPAAFATLSGLLSSNDMVSPMVLQWLGSFPASISDLYCSLDNVRYDTEVQGVARFLTQLPTKWKKLEAHCKELGSPPLVEDMFDGLSLASKVLQTTIFRTIARMIWETDSNVGANQGVEVIERLHSYNQAAFFQNQRRDQNQMAAAREAFRYALNAWRKFQALQAQTAAANRLANGGRSDSQAIFVLPDFVEQIFKLPPSLPVFSNGQQRPSANLTSPTPQVHQPHPSAHPLPSPAPNTARRQPRHAPPAGRATSTHHNSLVQSHGPAPPVLVPCLFPVPMQQHPPHPRLIFPHESETQPRAQPTEPDTIRSGLHQAHLRSPVLSSVKMEGAHLKLYRYVTSTSAVPPIRVNVDLPINAIRFDVSDEDYANIPKSHPSKTPGSRSGQILHANSRTYRLRCAAIPPQGFPTEKAWIEADTIWPDRLYYDLNGHFLETRRKLHHGRYLPIDLTAYIQRGQNTLTLFVNRESTDKRSFNYAVAVETIGVKTHEDIVASLIELTSADSLAAIQTSLSSSSAVGAEDDIAVTSSNTIINLFDPFYGDRMVRTPVRGSGCLHRDCFDLEIFLSTCTRETPDSPTKVDCWRCPICRGDVRPHTLIRDGFLVEVGKSLEAKGLDETRAIVVNADGTWAAKAEEKTGVRSASLEREERGGSAKKEVDVIELD